MAPGIALVFAALSTISGGPQTQTPAPNPIEHPRDRIYYPGDTERFKPLINKLARNIVLDQKEIWTSPLRINRRDAKWWILFGASTGALIATDQRTIGAFENSRGQIAWGNRISNIGASYTLIPLMAGFYIYGVVRDEPKPREVGVLGAETLLDSLILVEVLKVIAGRTRPDSPKEKRFFEGGTSFPSGHAIESWSIASLIAHEYHRGKWVPVLAYGLAAVVSSARFAAQRHYASDILAGGAMGWFIGRYVSRTHMDHAIHHHAWPRPRISPILQPSSGTYGIGLTFGR